MLLKVKNKCQNCPIRIEYLEAQKTKWLAFQVLACTSDIFVEFCCSNNLIVLNKSSNVELPNQSTDCKLIWLVLAFVLRRNSRFIVGKIVSAHV